MKTENEHLLLRDIYQTFSGKLNELDANSLEAAFANWISLASAQIIQAKPPQVFSTLDYRQIAQISFLCEIHPDHLPTFENQLTEGLNRIKGRAAHIIGGALAPFVTDVVALLGLAVGSNLIGGSLKQELKIWMEGFIPKEINNLPDWKRCIAFSALDLLGSSKSSEINAAGDLADVRIAFDHKGVKGLLQDTDGDNLLRSLAKHTVEKKELEPTYVSILFASLQCLLSAAPNLTFNKPTVNELITVLERLPGAFRRWPWEAAPKTTKSAIQKWDLQNEYHVQGLLYFLLSPLFPDLEDEFYADQIAQKNPRADLGIPSMRLIIEVKFLRSTVRFADLIEEIAADNSLYFKTGSEYRNKYEQLLVFVWDDSGRTQEYAKFKQGANQLSHVSGTVIMPRPGMMHYA